MAKSLGNKDVKFKNEDDNMKSHQMHLYEKNDCTDDTTTDVDGSMTLRPLTIQQIENEIKHLTVKIAQHGLSLGTRGAKRCTIEEGSIAGNKRAAENLLVETGNNTDDVVKRFRSAADHFNLEGLSQLSSENVVSFLEFLKNNNNGVKRKQTHTLLEYSGVNDLNTVKSGGMCQCFQFYYICFTCD